VLRVDGRPGTADATLVAVQVATAVVVVVVAATIVVIVV